MEIQLAESLQLIIDRYGNRTTGSVFIPMKDFPWYNERNGQLMRLHEEGMITKPSFSDNVAKITLTAKGRRFFTEKHWILFPAVNASFPCPVCDNQAIVVATDAARSWAEINCKNCGTYALRPDAIESIPALELPLLSGYYRHVWHEPLTMQCDTKETVRDHIEVTRKIVTRDYQMKMLLSYYYQKMSRFGQYISMEMLPAIAYAKDEGDLRSLMEEAEKKGLLQVDGELLSVTREGQVFIDQQEKEIMPNPTVFISYNWGSSDKTADELEMRLKPYADVKRDKKTVSAWGDLAEFMRSIRRQDFAVLVISDAYLKSEACLYEVMELMKDDNWDKRVMYVVERDAYGVYDTGSHMKYIGYWEDKERSLKEEIQKHNPAAVSAQAEELKIVNMITLNIGAFMVKVKRTNNPTYENAIKAIITRVNRSDSNPPEKAVIE